MLTKEAVADIVCKYYEMDGYNLIESDSNMDLILKKSDDLIKVIVIGSVGDASSTSKKGKGYNKNQAKTMIALALFDCLREISNTEEGCDYLLAMVDNKIFSKLIKEVKSELENMKIHVMLIAENGTVRVH